MKYLKKFENKLSVLGINENDYVKIKTDNIFNLSKDYNDFLNTHIGKIYVIGVNNQKITKSYVYVNFEIEKGSKYDYQDFTHLFKITQVEFSAKTKEELLQKITANKYNI